MGVYIKGVTRKQLMKALICSTEFLPEDCEITEIEEHGRLIDGDELKTAFPKCDNSKPVLVASVRATINHAPTVIEAEE